MRGDMPLQLLKDCLALTATAVAYWNTSSYTCNAVAQVRNSSFTAFIDSFTANTYIMVILSDPSIQTATTQLNIRAARRHFEKFVPQTAS
jgi:hypothetical protein